MNQSVGTSVIRKEGRAKVLGTAVYTDDLVLPGMIFGTTVRSPVARGRLKAVHFDPGVPWEEFTVVRASDIPGKNCVAHIIEDQLCLADPEINHPEEAVLLLAHPDKYLLEKARSLVRLEIEELPAVFDVEESIAQKTLIWGEDNCFKHILIEKGNPDSIWEQAAFQHQGTYRTEAQEHLYIEPNGVIAEVNEEGILVRGSLQCPYYVHHSLKECFGWPEEKIRVVQMETGGAFGGKEDFPSTLACHAALLAWKSGKPVKLIYDREEDMAASTKRHPSRTHVKSAFDAEGRLLALDIDFVLDGGAYLTLSPVVLSRGAIHACGPYNCPNTRILARAVATNRPPHGAFRGFGAPQSFFALERHLTEAAFRMGMDPAELRRRNFIRIGDTLATGQIVKENVNMEGLLDKALQEIAYQEKKAAFKAHNAQDHPLKKGLGLACFMHGGGFTGSGEVFLASIAGVDALPDGRIRVLAANTEMGQGATTVFTQIAADALGLPVEMVEVAQPDTAIVPNSGPTVASRTTMIVGKLVQDACVALKATLLGSGWLKSGYGPEDFRSATLRWLGERGSLKFLSQYQRPPQIVWDDKTYQGDAYATYAWACYAAEVEVDTLTYESRVTDFVAVQEVGKVINPVLCEGQVEGGVTQGIGYALSEDIVWNKGRMANNQFTNYIIPTAQDLPRIRVFFQEDPYPGGPQGAKGIGELPMDGTAPAILNAVEHALGVPPRQTPLTPERLLDLLEKPNV